jgi:hypothetical protein
MRRFAAVLAAGLAAAAQAAAAQSPDITNNQMTLLGDAVALRGLDTLNGIAQDIDLRVGETVRFGYLEITADTCRIPEDNPQGDAYVFLRIRDIREEAPRFSGWMFASSPALSALDHPRYDVWVQSCSMR